MKSTLNSQRRASPLAVAHLVLVRWQSAIPKLTSTDLGHFVASSLDESEVKGKVRCKDATSKIIGNRSW
jgi:hypothetical protein